MAKPSSIPVANEAENQAVIDIKLETPKLTALAKRRLPTIEAQTLNQLAFRAQQAVRGAIPGRFHLKRNWIITGVRYRKATPSHRLAEVFSRDFFMTKQEEGGSTITRKGKRLSVPVRRLQSEVINFSKRPSALMRRKNFFATEEGIFERLGRGRKRQWYLFTPENRFRRRFKFKETVEQEVNDQAQIIFDEAFNRYLG